MALKNAQLLHIFMNAADLNFFVALYGTKEDNPRPDQIGLIQHLSLMFTRTFLESPIKRLGPKAYFTPWGLVFILFN